MRTRKKKTKVFVVDHEIELLLFAEEESEAAGLESGRDRADDGSESLRGAVRRGGALPGGGGDGAGPREPRAQVQLGDLQDVSHC